MLKPQGDDPTLLQTNKESLSAQLENELSHLIQEKLELILREEIRNFLEVEHPELDDSRNGYYTRTLDTRFGPPSKTITSFRSANLARSPN